jgi:selenocysteine-specific elongation factor
MIVATAGHVDHGKTSLVKALTGIDADRLPEEKKRGMTIDLGFAYLPVEDGGSIGFVDVPGHERFVHNMLAGVSGMDCALLVIAADDGPMPQTREHLSILELLGVRIGAVALTKVDRVDAVRVKEAEREIAVMFAEAGQPGAPVFALSAITGEGMPALREHLLQLCSTLRQRAAAGLFRMTVDRSFTLAGAGLVVTGTILAGEVSTGDQVGLLLAGSSARVRGMHAQNRAVPKAHSGERCALNLAGLPTGHAQIARGDIVAASGAAPPALRIDIELRLLPSEPRALRHWTPVHVHVGAADVTGRVALLEGDTLAPGGSMLAQLVLDHPVATCHGERVVLRDQSAQRTLGGGKVVDVFAPPRGRARPERLAHLRALANDDPQVALAAALDTSPSGLDLTRFAACRSLSAAELEAIACHTDMLRIGADLGFARGHWENARLAALAVVKAWHARTPDSPGVPADRLLEGSRMRFTPAARAALAEDLAGAGKLVRNGAALRLPDHQSGLNPADQALWDRIRKVIDAADLRPPSVAEISTATKLQPKRIKDLLARLARQQMIWRVSEERFALPGTVHAWTAHAVALGGADGTARFAATDFRDRSGVGRNLSIEILEFFDRVKLTRRIGDLRLLQGKPLDIFGPPI